MHNTSRSRLRIPGLTTLLAAALLLPALTMNSGCAGRWQPATPIVDAGCDQQQARENLDNVLARARAAGYVADTVDLDRGFLRFRAKLGDGGMEMHGVAPPNAGGYQYMHGTSTQSWFTVQLDQRGALVLSATGYAVKENKRLIHKKLRAELQSFAELTGITPGPGRV